MSGDFWQQRPPGQIALMSNPFACKAEENARAALIMGMFWFGDTNFSLQSWKGQERMLHLDVNERSGADKWYDSFLQAARLGNVDEDTYNFLHGYPTRGPVTYWHHRNDDSEFDHKCTPCEYKPYHVRDFWDAWPVNDPPECVDCWTERKRRARVLHLDSHWEQDCTRVADRRFAEAVLVTPYNVACSTSR